MRVAMIGSARFGVREPVDGGMESMLRTLALALHELGHEVTVHAGAGPAPASIAPGLIEVPLVEESFVPSAAARRDVSMPPGQFMAEHHAYLKLGRRLATTDYDVIHNHSAHHLPPLYDVATPMVHTLHSPPTPWLESAHALRARPHDPIVTVSQANADLWGGLVDVVVPNGVDLGCWGTRSTEGRGDVVVWSGRLVPEKGAHLAIDAARRAGRPIHLAGPRHDAAYFAAEISPRLDHDVRYLGHLDSVELAAALAQAAVVVVSPLWDEPYGLVVAEALAAGTPVAAFGRGGVPELVDSTCGALASTDDVDALAAAIQRAATLDPEACRHRAVTHCSAAIMASRYVELYQSLVQVGRLSEAC